MNAVSSKVIAACFALSAFAVAILAGLAGDVAIAQILLRAVMAMLICYPVGLAVGTICTHIIGANIAEHASRQEALSEAAGSSAMVPPVAAAVDEDQAIVV